MSQRETHSSPWKRALSSPLAWVGDFLVERWVPIVLSVGTFVGTARIASLSKTVLKGEPIWILAAALAASLVVASIYALLAVGRAHYFTARYVERRAQAGKVNPLDPLFTRQRILLSDFYHPFLKPTVAAKFDGCEFFGPCAVVLDGCQLLGGVFSECEAIVARPDVPIRGVILFRNCTFQNSTFYRVSFVMREETYAYFNSQIKGDALPVITYLPPQK